MSERVNSMRIGGWVMLALAAWQLVERFVLSFWLDVDKAGPRAFGFATFDVLLGVAMLQGSETARKVVLLVTGLAALALGFAIFGLQLGGFGHLWPILGATLAAVVGIFVLNFMSEPPLGVVILSLFLVAAGWVGSTVSSILLVGTLDLSTIRMLREWSSTDRSFAEESGGVELRAPGGWVLLRGGNPIRNQERALVTLANTEIIAFAQVFRSVGGYSSGESLDYSLDTVLKNSEAGTQGFERIGVSQTRIGDVPARRAKTSWKVKDATVLGYFTAWQDGNVFYHLYLLGPGVLAKRLDLELEKLESSITFHAPWSAFLREQAPLVRGACPLLSDGAILGLARSIPKESPPELYCEEGYRLAFLGQPYLDAASGEQLRALMKRFFTAIPRGQLTAFGGYTERIRAGHRLQPAEERSLAAIAQKAVGALDPSVRESLRGYFAMAIDMGRHERSVR